MSKHSNIKEYIATLPEDRLEAFEKLRATINKNIPKGFEEVFVYGMPGHVVPLSTYPDGYHCAKDAPLPFSNLGNRGKFIAVYHMGVYANQELHHWFTEEYAKRCKYKLDMGKSCIRLKKMDDIPYDLIGELYSKMTVQNWIDLYEKNILKK